MRGKAMQRVSRSVHSWITPAYAGKSIMCRAVVVGTRDHPRVCGEKYKGVTVNSAAVGITPAYAGKSAFPDNFPSISEDHPRVCGEKPIPYIASAKNTGSPPRMRGKVASSNTKNAVTRITPAYAGKRLKRSRSTVPPVAIVPLFPSVCNKPVVSDGSPAGRDVPLFLPAENAAPASPTYNLRSL